MTAADARKATDKFYEQRRNSLKNLAKLKKQKLTRARNKYKTSPQFVIDVEAIKYFIETAIKESDYRIEVNDGDMISEGGDQITLNEISLHVLFDFFINLGYTTEINTSGSTGTIGNQYNTNSIKISW